MKKKNKAIYLITALTFGALTAGSLAGCTPNKPDVNVNDDKNKQDSFKITLDFDSTIGSCLLYDDKGAVTNSIDKDKTGVLKVGVSNTYYEIDSVKIGEQALTYDSSKDGYIISNLTSDATVKVSYKKVYSNLKLDLTHEKIDSYKLYVNGELTKNKDSHKLKVGDEIAVEIITTSDIKGRHDIEVKANEEVLTKDDITNLYSFTLGEKDVTVKAKITCYTEVNFSLGSSLEAKYYINDILQTKEPTLVPLDSKIVIEATITNDEVFDESRSSLVNYTDGVSLTEKEGKIEVSDKTIKATIYKAGNISYLITLATKTLGKYNGEDFVGTWSAKIGKNNVNNNPTVSLDDNGNCSLSFMDGKLILSGTYVYNDDKTLAVKFTDGTKNVTGSLLVINDGETPYGLYGEVSGNFVDEFLLFKEREELGTFTTYNFVTPSTKSLIAIENTASKGLTWIYSNDKIFKVCSVSNLDDTPASKDLVDDTTYNISIDGSKHLFKVSEGSIILAGVEQGTYTSAETPEDTLILDGYGNATLNDLSAPYTYDEALQLVKIKGTINKSFVINAIDNTYKTYVAKKNVLSGFTYFFRADDHDVDYPSITDVWLTFVNDTTLLVNSTYQADNAETTYTLAPDGSFETVLPLVCGNKKIKGKFNKSYTSIDFETRTLIFNGDMVGVNGELKKIDYTFTSKNTESLDTLKINPDLTYAFNDDPVKEYFLDISGNYPILKGEKNYKLNLVDKTFEIVEKRPGNWFIYETFEGTYKNDDRETTYNLQSKIVFDQSTSDTISYLKLSQKSMGWEGTDSAYEGRNLKYTYDAVHKYINIDVNGYNVQLYNDEPRGCLRYVCDPQLNGKYYYANGFEIVTI